MKFLHDISHVGYLYGTNDFRKCSKLNADVWTYFRAFYNFSLPHTCLLSVTTSFEKTFFDLLGIAQSRVLVCRWVWNKRRWSRGNRDRTSSPGPFAVRTVVFRKPLRANPSEVVLPPPRQRILRTGRSGTLRRRWPPPIFVNAP